MSPLVAYALLFTAWARYIRCDVHYVMSEHLLNDIGISQNQFALMRTKTTDHRDKSSRGAPAAPEGDVSASTTPRGS